MAETIHEFFLIKATSKVTGNIHYVEVDDEGFVSLVDKKTEATMFTTRNNALKGIKRYCEDEETHEYTVDSVMMSSEEFMTEH